MPAAPSVSRGLAKAGPQPAPTYSVDPGMTTVTRISAFMAATALALALVSSGSANATQAVAGPDGSLTVVEDSGSHEYGSSASTLYTFNGSLRQGFSAPVLLSEQGDEAEAPALAVDGTGDVLAVWSASRTYREHPETLRGPHQLTVPRGVWYAWRPAGGSFSAPQQLAAPAPGQRRVLAAMDQAGEAAVAYEERGSVYLQRARANGSFGPATKVTGGPYRSEAQTARLDYLGFDDAGELFVVSNRAGWIEARFAGPDGKPRRAQVLRPPLPKGGNIGIVVAAMNGQGRAVIAWADDGGLFGVYRKPGRRFGPRHGLVPSRQAPAESSLSFSTELSMDERGRTVFVVLRTPGGTGLAPPSFPELIEWNGQSKPSTRIPLYERFPFGGYSVARNEADETAINYGDAPSETQLAVDVRFSSNGQPFGPSQMLQSESGLIGCPYIAPNHNSLEYGSGRTELSIKENLACEESPTLVGASGNTFFAVTGVWWEPHHLTYAKLVRIRSVSQTSVTPPITINLPEFVLPQAALPPATFADFSASATLDRRARIHGDVQCGSGEGGCSVQISLKETASQHLTVGHATVQLGYLQSRSVAITLNRFGRRELARRGRLEARLVTKTMGMYGSPLETSYPLTILARHRG